jgi:hypothetical protein
LSVLLQRQFSRLAVMLTIMIQTAPKDATKGHTMTSDEATAAIEAARQRLLKRPANGRGPWHTPDEFLKAKDTP